MSIKQMTMWENEIPHAMTIEMEALKLKQDSLRRGIFQRYDDLRKEVEVLTAQLEVLTDVLLEKL